MLNRVLDRCRHLLAPVFVLLGLPGYSIEAKAELSLAYVGGSSEQVGVYRFHPENGRLEDLGALHLPGKNPSFLAFHPDLHILYTANESGQGSVFSMTIDPRDGRLSFLNEVFVSGDGPTHVAIDKTGRWLFAAFYNSGMVRVYPILNDGRIGPEADKVFAGNQAHQVISSPDGAAIYIPCKGSDYIAQYRFDATTGKLAPLPSPQLGVASKSGPRHLAWHPSGAYAFLVNELDSTVQTLRIDPLTLQLSPLGEALSSLEKPVPGNTGAEVQTSEDGRFVYTSNRGDDSIAQFSVETDGHLRFLGTKKTGGSIPRHFSLAHRDRWVLVANQGSSNVSVLERDPVSGALQDAGQRIPFASAQYVEVVVLP